jgi:predicted Zn-dependent protease
MEARHHFLAAIRLNRNNPKLHVYLINLLLQCKEYGQASEAVANALKLFPHEVSIVNGRALLLMQTGRPQEALGVLKDELRFSPDERALRALIAIIAKQQRDYAEAIDQFTYLMENDSTRLQQRYNRAEMYYESGRYNEARKDVDTLLLTAPNDPVIRKFFDRMDEKMEQTQ